MLIFAHRGASNDAPENTMTALREGFRQGADGVEIDIRLTLDGKAVAVHDKDFLRTTGAKNLVAKTMAAEVMKMDAGAFKGEKFLGEKVPFLEEILDETPDGKLIQLDIKSGEASVPKILSVIKNGRKKIDEIMIISSRLRVLESVREHMNEIFTALVYGKRPIYRKSLPKIETLIYSLKKAGAYGIDFDCRLHVDKKYMDLLYKFGIKTYSWTVNDPQKASYLKELGITGITTNIPSVIDEALKKEHREIYE